MGVSGISHPCDPLNLEIIEVIKIRIRVDFAPETALPKIIYLLLIEIVLV